MLHANSQTTRLVIKERFNRALLDTLDHASHNIIEAKMRVCVSQVIDRNQASLYLVVKRLQKQGYLMYDVVMNIVEELFEDECSWYFIVCLCAVIETCVKNTYLHCCEKNHGDNFKHLMYSGHSAQAARFVDYAMRGWIDDKGGWMNFNNNFEVNSTLEENRLIRKFYNLICLNTY